MKNEPTNYTTSSAERQPLPFWRALYILAGIFGIATLEAIVYWFYKSNWWTILGNLVLVTIILVLKLTRDKRQKTNDLRTSLLAHSPTSPLVHSSTHHIYFFIVLMLETVLLTILLTHQTVNATPSPWMQISAVFFLIYLSATALIFYLISKLPSALSLSLICLHSFITYSVVAILYPLGYGYDPFLHRAAETEIFRAGFILPKTPFYLGQYSLINILAHLTHLPIKWLDIWLVPTLASFLIPLSAGFGLKYGANLANRLALTGAFLTLLFPISTLVTTTPYNLAIVVAIIILFLSLAHKNFPALRPILIILTLFILATHPLVGVPLLFFVVYYCTSAVVQTKYKIWWGLYIFLGIISLPLLFYVYQAHLTGIWHLDSAEIKNNLMAFLKIFAEPYYVVRGFVGYPWEMVHFYERIFPFLIFGLGILGARKNKLLMSPFIASGLAVFLQAAGIGIFVHFPELDPTDAIQYTERLLSLSLLFFIPPALIYLLAIINRSKKYGFIIFSFLSVCLMLSLYIRYPQFNPKVQFPGYNVTAADIKAIKIIHATDDPYIVLSPAPTAAVAIEAYGFLNYYQTTEGRQFYYAIPSGSPLYKRFLQMVYEKPTREIIEEAMELTNTKIAYFVLPRYWANAENIFMTANQTADKTEIIDGGDIFILKYIRRARI